MAHCTVLAVDIGAESGRVVAVRFDGARLALEEAHRFANHPVDVRGTLHWDVLSLWREMQAGIARAGPADAIGLDTWGVDYALLDARNRLLGNPVHYRDLRTDGMIDWVLARVPRETLFKRTGIQLMPINTLYQLASLVHADDPQLRDAQRLVNVPDLLYYWLSGELVNEYTIASTSQCYDVAAGDWAWGVLDTLGIPSRLFGPVTHPGELRGAHGRTPAVIVPHHDTGCAVVGVPLRQGGEAYLSSGTWSLLGLELARPIVNPAAMRANATNEGGYGHTVRFLKNIMGLWLLQESRRAWSELGAQYSYEALAGMAATAAPFRSLIDPDRPELLAPGDIPARIRAACIASGQPAPESQAQVTRCIFESLALKYRAVLDQLAGLAGVQVDTLHVVGGGARNALLCQMTADATGRVVLAGPVEATALGNAVVQLIALGEVRDVAQGRALIRESFIQDRYEPAGTARWEAAQAWMNAVPPTEPAG